MADRTSGGSSSPSWSAIAVSTKSAGRKDPAWSGGEPAPDHNGLQIHIEPGGDQRLDRVGHHHDFVDRLVIGATPRVRPPLRTRRSWASVSVSTTDFRSTGAAVCRAGGRRRSSAARWTDRRRRRWWWSRPLRAIALVGQGVVDDGDGLGELVVLTGGRTSGSTWRTSDRRVRPVQLDRDRLREQFGAVVVVLIAGVYRHRGGQLAAGPPVGTRRRPSVARRCCGTSLTRRSPRLSFRMRAPHPGVARRRIGAGPPATCARAASCATNGRSATVISARRHWACRTAGRG